MVGLSKPNPKRLKVTYSATESTWRAISDPVPKAQRSPSAPGLSDNVSVVPILEGHKGLAWLVSTREVSKTFRHQDSID